MLNQIIKAPQKLLLAALLCYSNAAFTLETDKQQDVQWSSDGDAKMRMEGDVRILTYIENVKVTQGTLLITGSEAIFEYSASTNELIKVTIYGNPVRYQQQLDADEGMVEGSSQTMLFYTDTVDGETILEMIGDASIESPDSKMSCVAITYLADRDLIREAKGPCQGVLSTPTD